MRLRLLLVEDHTLVRSGIRSLLEAAGDVEVVGECDDGRQAVDNARTLKPDLVLMDVGMGQLNGIDATRQIVNELPNTRVMMLSMYGDEQYIHEAFKAGARGYVLKSAAVKELLSGVREVCAGRTYVSPSLSAIVMDDYARRARGPHAATAADKLTAREREILQLISEGKSSAEIARTLYISVRTVETHRHNIMEKLEIHSTAGLTKFAIRHGLSSLQ